MKKLSCGVALLLSIAGFVWAQSVTVYDVGVEPDSPNKKVTVSYRLAETNAGVANVAVEISSDAGATWTVPATTFYPGSDIGPGIPADGSLRQFVWDARVDWNQQYSTQMIVRLEATAAEAQDGIYYVLGDKLYRMNLDGSAHSLLYSGLPKCVYMDTDEANNRLLLTSWDSGSPVLSYDTVKGGDVSTLYNGPGINGGQGIAFDEATSTIFYGLYYNGVYAFNELDTDGWQQLVASSALSPMLGQRGQMEVDPANEQVYFRSAYNGTCDDCRWIWRVNYDGSGLTQITQANGHGDAMTLDLAAGHIYFMRESDAEAIWRCNLDGSGLELVMAIPAPYVACLALELDVPANKMYMYLFSSMDWRSGAIARADMDGTNFEVLKETSLTQDGYGLGLFLR